jgi:hypothetical protein
MRRLMLFATISIASSPGLTQPTPDQGHQTPMSAEELNNQAAGARGFRPKDEFDTPPAQASVAGRRFVIEVQPWGTSSPRVACFGYPMWSYDSTSGTLYVSTGGSKLMLHGFLTNQGIVTKKPVPDHLGEEVHYFASDCARADLPSYTASNAYGAEFRINPTLQTVTAVADNPPSGSALTKSFAMKLAGAEARSLVPNLRVRFRGTLAEWKQGVSVACGKKRDGPSARSPYDRKLDLCLFNAHVDQIELVDVRTGRILQSATREAK